MSEHVRWRRAPGFACPACGVPIVIDPAVLLSAAPLGCSACGLELRVDAEASAGALAALQRFMGEFSQIAQRVSPTIKKPTRRGRAPRPRRPRRRTRNDA